MEFYEIEILNEWYFNIKLPLYDTSRLTYSCKDLIYIYSIRRYVYKEHDEYLYESEPSDGVFTFQTGYASYVYNEFYNQLSDSDRNKLEYLIFPKDDIKVNFNNLFDYQNEDLNQLLRVRRGIFQTYTGYGKSEVIASLANYIGNTLKQKVLIVTATRVSLEELKSRFRSRFNLEFDDGYIDKSSNINIININGYLRSYSYDPSDTYWSCPMWILADEVENCCTETSMEFFENIPNIIRMYGFSATADKQMAEPLLSRIPNEFYNSDEVKGLKNLGRFEYRHKLVSLENQYKYNIRTALGRNKYLVGFFSNSAVFRKPSKFDIKIINISTTISNDSLSQPSSYQYDQIISSLFTDDKVCKLIESIAYKVGLIFIPMFRLQIIDYWLEHYFRKHDYITAVICGRGIELYDGGEFQDYITLDELKILVKLGSVNLILGTKSSYNSMDLPQLNRSLLLYSKAANIVIQAIGRTARPGKFEIYSITPYKYIPIYTKDLNNRLNLIKKYYSDCNIVEVKKNENEF
jgi:hypothetical protein